MTDRSDVVILREGEQLTLPGEPFGRLLAGFRLVKSMTQQQLAEHLEGVSASYVAMLETKRAHADGRRILSRDKLWNIIETLDLFPPDCDDLLEAAGHSRDRGTEEELSIQKRFPSRTTQPLKELWIFARIIRDPDEEWYRTVRNNILNHGVVYRYFTEDDTNFAILKRRLETGAGSNTQAIKNRLECYVLPSDLFLTNFAVYNPGLTNMYCCGTKPEHGKAEAFYTMHISEANRLFEVLRRWRAWLQEGHPIVLGRAKQVYPAVHKSIFTSDQD